MLVLILLISSTANSKVLEGPGIPHYIRAAAAHFQLDAALMYAICKVESQCKPSAINKNDGTAEQKKFNVKSPSHGLFQLKLATARGVGFKGKSYDLLVPGVNAYYAAKLLHILYSKYGPNTPKVLSAYNAGHYTKANKDYVSKVLNFYSRIKIDKRS